MPGAQSRFSSITNMLLIHAISYWEKRWWRNGANQSPPSNFILRHVNTDSSNDGGGGGSTDARRTNRTMAHYSSHTDTVGNNHMGNTHSSPDSRNSLPGIQPQFRPKPERQNAAPERKPIHLPPMLLREPFSSSLFCLPTIRREVRQKASRSSSGRDRRTSKRQRTDTVGCRSNFSCSSLAVLNVHMNIKRLLARFGRLRTMAT